MQTGLLIAFIVLGLVLVAGIVLWVIFGNKHRALKKQRKLREQENENQNTNENQGGF